MYLAHCLSFLIFKNEIEERFERLLSNNLSNTDYAIT